jgi:hypothetical protein
MNEKIRVLVELAEEVIDIFLECYERCGDLDLARAQAINEYSAEAEHWRDDEVIVMVPDLDVILDDSPRCCYKDCQAMSVGYSGETPYCIDHLAEETSLRR